MNKWLEWVMLGLCILNTLMNIFFLIVHLRSKQAVDHQKGLSGSMHCPHCFKAYDVNLKNCPHCGHSR